MITTKLLPVVQLVNKDQVDMLASLRASVSQENQGLTLETRRLEEQLVAAAETSRAQDRTINKLLLDKIDLQSDSIGQRERMLERERHMSYVPVVMLAYCSSTLA